MARRPTPSDGVGRTESGEVASSGVYFCRLRAEEGGFDQKLVKTQ